MLYEKFKKTLKDRLKTATDSELMVIANGNEPDAKKVANTILLERMSRNKKRTIGFTDEDFAAEN